MTDVENTTNAAAGNTTNTKKDKRKAVMDAIKTLSADIEDDADWTKVIILWQKIHEPYVKDNTEKMTNLLDFLLTTIKKDFAEQLEKTEKSYDQPKVRSVTRRYTFAIWWQMMREEITMDILRNVKSEEDEQKIQKILDFPFGQKAVTDDEQSITLSMDRLRIE